MAAKNSRYYFRSQRLTKLFPLHNVFDTIYACSDSAKGITWSINEYGLSIKLKGTRRDILQRSSCLQTKQNKIIKSVNGFINRRMWWAYQGKSIGKRTRRDILQRWSRLQTKQNQIIKSGFRFLHRLLDRWCGGAIVRRIDCVKISSSPWHVPFPEIKLVEIRNFTKV